MEKLCELHRLRSVADDLLIFERSFVSQRSPLGTGSFIFASRYLIRVILQSRSQCIWCTSFSKQNTIVDSVRKLKLQIVSRRFMSSLEVAPVCALLCQTGVYLIVVVMLSYGWLITLVNSNFCFVTFNVLVYFTFE